MSDEEDIARHLTKFSQALRMNLSGHLTGAHGSLQDKVDNASMKDLRDLHRNLHFRAGSVEHDSETNDLDTNDLDIDEEDRDEVAQSDVDDAVSVASCTGKSDCPVAPEGVHKEDCPKELKVDIMCAKGCNTPVSTPLRLLKEAQNAGRPFVAQHDVCPGEDGGMRGFRINITVEELVQNPKRKPDEPVEAWTVVGKAGSGLVEDATLARALPMLSQKLNEVWSNKIASLAGMVDANPPSWDEL